MRIEQPAMREAGVLRLTRERQGALDGVLGLEGEAELHAGASVP